eukprot:SM001728S03261  [mRNA]  locus=s1728:80:549:+ [translate_table: standard]
MDFLNDHLGVPGALAACPCARGSARAPMRRWAGGLIIAFLRSVLRDEPGPLDAILAHPEACPIRMLVPKRTGANHGQPGEPLVASPGPAEADSTAASEQAAAVPSTAEHASTR